MKKIRNIITLCLLCHLFIGCKTTKIIETTDSIASYRLEKERGIELNNKTTTKIDSVLKDRFLMLVVNEKGDTIKEKEVVKEKEYIYINDSVNILKDVIKELKDSLKNSHNKTTEITKYKYTINYYLVGIIAVLIGIIVFILRFLK